MCWGQRAARQGRGAILGLGQFEDIQAGFEEIFDVLLSVTAIKTVKHRLGFLHRGAVPLGLCPMLVHRFFQVTSGGRK